MYHPGGAMFGSAGALAFRVSGGSRVKGTSTRRWVPLNEWVVRPGRIRLIHLICVACELWILMAELYLISSGAFWITGRGFFLKKKGGIKNPEPLLLEQMGRQPNNLRTFAGISSRRYNPSVRQKQ